MYGLVGRPSQVIICLKSCITQQTPLPVFSDELTVLNVPESARSYRPAAFKHRDLVIGKTVPGLRRLPISVSIVLLSGYCLEVYLYRSSRLLRQANTRQSRLSRVISHQYSTCQQYCQSRSHRKHPAETNCNLKPWKSRQAHASQ